MSGTKQMHDDVSKNSRQMKFPFHSIVVTSPDSIAALAALNGPLKRENLTLSRDCEEEITIISTSDPFDTRMGSGGGTLAALQEADSVRNSQVVSRKGSTLIIHAGGQSSRCPTQMTLGKAWTDLPLLDGEQLTNPTYILMDSLSDLLRNLPNGSVVVAASDVMLDLPRNSPISFENVSNDKVLGLAVPAPLTTAKNHGVFSIEGDHCNQEETNGVCAIRAVDTFFQKPSVETMKNFQGCTFPKDEQDMAWIDTGVIIFLPNAADALRNLLNRDLSLYTRKGLEERIRENKSSFPGATEVSIAKSLVDSKLELYSHLLLAISTKGAKKVDTEKDRLKKYLSNESNSDFSTMALEKIFASLSSFELQVCTVPDGSFIHLGTTAELLKFLVAGASTSEDNQNVKSEFKLSRRIQTFLNGVFVSKDSVIMNSIIDSSSSPFGKSTIGTSSVVEHCHLEGTTLKVGTNCVVSGLRGCCHSTIEIPSNMVLQFLPLREGNEGNKQYVCMYLGISDGIKEHGRLFGVSFNDFLNDTGLTFDDLWDTDDTKRYLWSSRIHAIISLQNDGTFDWEPFKWMQHYVCAGREGFSEPLVKASLEKWKQMTRLSLSQIQGMSDASSEFAYRSGIAEEGIDMKLEHTIASIKDVLLGRRHEQLKFDYVLDSVRAETQKKCTKESMATLAMFRDVVLSSVKDRSYDIGCRSFMLLSKFYTELSEEVEQVPSMDVEFAGKPIFLHLQSLKSMSNDPYDDCKSILDHIESTIKVALDTSNHSLLVKCAEQLEDAAFSLTSRCVSSSIPDITVSSKSSPPCETWIVSNAPARVDLSGGWSDTPPVSYEFGGAVACLAVTLRNRKPLSARCRRTKHVCGIKLVVENRDIDSGDLIESESILIAKMKDLSDFRNPQAKCALSKCALIALGVIPISDITENEDKSIEDIIENVYGEKVGIEIISTSLLPHGSGLGTSSILAGCVLSSLGQCLGFEKVKDRGFLIRAVLNLEQLLRYV